MTLTRWNRDVVPARFDLLPLAEVRINGKPVNLEGLKRFHHALTTALATPMDRDRNDYLPFFADLVDEQRVEVHSAFSIIVAANYAALAGRGRGEDEQTVLSSLLFGDFSCYPFLLVDQAFKIWRRSHNWFPTPCDIIRIIEGYEGEWCGKEGVRKGSIYSLRAVYKSMLDRMEKIIAREEQPQVQPSLTHSKEATINTTSQFEGVNHDNKARV